MKEGEESPETVFDRIRQRRAADPKLPSERGRAGGSFAPAVAREVGAPGAKEASSVATPLPATRTMAAPDGVLVEETPAHAEQFPRSATIRLLLRRPELALAVGLPATGLLLRYPGSRRLIGAALRLGTRPEVQQAVQLSTALRHRARRAGHTAAAESPPPLPPKPPKSP